MELPAGSGRPRLVVAGGELDGLELGVELTPDEAAQFAAGEPGALLGPGLTGRLLAGLAVAQAGVEGAGPEDDELLAAEAQRMREER